MRESITFHAIGTVHNSIDQPLRPDAFREVESQIVLDPDLIAGLTGLESGQRIIILFHFDRAGDYELLQHPRGDKSRPKRGVFALRSPRRPNGIGVTVVDLLTVESNILTVRGLDAINGTPVLDIKLEER